MRVKPSSSTCSRDPKGSRRLMWSADKTSLFPVFPTLAVTTARVFFFLQCVPLNRVRVSPNPSRKYLKRYFALQNPLGRGYHHRPASGTRRHSCDEERI